MGFVKQYLPVWLLALTSGLYGQSVELIPDPGFVPYASYYISGIDLTTGASDVLFFGYRLEEATDDYESREVWVQLEFRMTMLSPPLGIQTPTTVIHLIADFNAPLSAHLRIDNRELSTETQALYDLASKRIPIVVRILDQLDIAKFESVLSSITSTGKLADGEYSFHVIVRSGPSQSDLSVSDEVTETILVTTPTSLNLIAPGGALADTNQRLIYSPYPIFQWDAEQCPGCQSYIRVAEFNPLSHSSTEEAIEDRTTLPLDQTKGWELVGIATSFQYPFTGAVELVPGQVYVWQVSKILPTTGGTESYLSPIFAFKIADLSQAPQMGIEGLSPIVQQLAEIIGEEQFNAYFGPGGILAGYSPTGMYTMNEMDVPVDAVISLLAQIRNRSVSIVEVSVE